MKKLITAFFTVMAMVAISGTCFAKTKYTYITPKAPVITESLKPCIVKYRQGNYTGAIVDLKALLQNEKNNEYARYYLGLSYMQLGFVKEAEEAFNKVISSGSNESLSFYSQNAITCLKNPDGGICAPEYRSVTSSAPNVYHAPVKGDDKEAVKEDMDMTEFIYSKKRVHPAAMDLIIRERMEVKLQQDEYKRKQNEQLGPLSSAPTNEEIAFALSTLSKIGLNPFEQNYTLSNVPELNYNYNLTPYSYKNSTSDIGQMFLYNQLSQQKNNFINYGI